MENNQFAMVSEWMVNRNINEYVKEHWDVNRFELVGFQFFCRLRSSSPNRLVRQLQGVTKGLIYLHGQGMIHGDLKGVCLRIRSPKCPFFSATDFGYKRPTY